jgi:vacuolar-type H+-ATPase subunit I/STV1
MKFYPDFNRTLLEKRKLEAEKNRKEQAKQAEINARKRNEQEKVRKLLKNFDLYPSDVNRGDEKKLTAILSKVNRRIRLSQDELAWLMVSRRGIYSGYYTLTLQKNFGFAM